MAAIDKIYVKNKEQYKQFKDWCKKQQPLCDKYGKKEFISTYLRRYTENDWKENEEKPIFNAPYYIDAYLIRNCPFDFIQEELMINYGHWSQERIKGFYNDVVNWNGEEECPYWAKKEDFTILDDGTIELKGLEESDYTKILKGELYTSPATSKKYEVGKHFRCIKHPKQYYNRPFKCKGWFVSINEPDGMPYMWYHNETKSWDFADEYVIASWSSSSANVKTIKSLKRYLIKWKLPVGTKVQVTGRYIPDTYEFIITK